MTTQTRRQAVVYPESDGQPMADNTLQFEYIATIKGGLDAVFKADPEVFVAGDLFWYPVEGHPEIRTAPDVLVALGRPKGHRGSYQQWDEGDAPPQVVFEVLSPGNTVLEMTRKLGFYDRYGVEEYYLYDPDRGELSGWRRGRERLVRIRRMQGWVSPRLGVRFELTRGELYLYGPDGRRFLTYVELVQQQEEDRRRAEEAQRQARDERRRAEEAQQQAQDERRRAEDACQRAERLAAKLRSLGVEPDG